MIVEAKVRSRASLQSCRWIVVALVASTVPACSMFKKGAGDAGDAGEGGTAVAPVEAAPALAANESDITRYPDEKATPGGTLTTEGPAELRTEVGSGGKLVVVLKKGTEVDKVAEHASHYLVVSEDPKESSRKLMGWASETAFSTGGGGGGAFHGPTPSGHPGDAGAAPSGGGGGAAGFSCVKQEAGKCPAGYAAHEALCRIPCTSVAECKGPEPKCVKSFCYASNGCQ
jgi:hypothetical protein